MLVAAVKPQTAPTITKTKAAVSPPTKTKATANHQLKKAAYLKL